MNQTEQAQADALAHAAWQEHMAQRQEIRLTSEIAEEIVMAEREKARDKKIMALALHNYGLYRIQYAIEKPQQCWKAAWSYARMNTLPIQDGGL